MGSSSCSLVTNNGTIERLTFDLEPSVGRGLAGAIGSDALEHAAVLHGQLLDLERSVFGHEIPTMRKRMPPNHSARLG